MEREMGEVEKTTESPVVDSVGTEAHPIARFHHSPLQ